MLCSNSFISYSEGWMLFTHFVWVLVPPLLGVFWYQWPQLGVEMNELFVQVDAIKGRKLTINDKETNKFKMTTLCTRNSLHYSCSHFKKAPETT